MRPTVIGRVGELDAVERLLGALVMGPSALVFEGEPGIGKTTLVRHAVERARERGARVLSCGGSASETHLAHAALTDLLGEPDGALLAALPAPQRDALEVALLRAAPSPAGVDPRAVAAATLSLLTALAADRPLLVAVDDVQWLDGPSASVLEFCARRLDGAVGLLVARRTEEGRRVAIELPGGEQAEVRRVGPLDGEPLARLLRERGGQRLERSALARIGEASGGNPFYALELARALPRDGDGGGPAALALPPGLREVVASRLDGLPAAVEEVLLAAALLSDPTLPLLVETVGPRAPRLLEEAEARAIVERHGPRVRFSHPLLAHGVAERAAAPARRAMHRRLSAVVADPEGRARHLAHAGVLPEALPALEAAARHTRARGAPAAAAELLELALELGGAAALRVQAAEHHVDAGDVPRALELLERAVSDGPPGPSRAHALLLLGEIRYRHDSYTDARELLERASAEAGDDLRLRVMIGLRLVFALFNLGLAPVADEVARDARSRAERLGDDGLLGQALAVTAIVDFFFGRGFDERRIERALALEDPALRTSGELRPSVIGAFLLSWTGRLDESIALLDRLTEEFAARGEELSLAWMTSRLVWVACWQGDLARAERAADEAERRLLALETPNGRLLALTARGQVDAYRGRAESARAAAEEALALVARTSWAGAAAWQLMTLGFLELSCGDVAAAAERLAPVAAAAVAQGLPEPGADGVLIHGDAAEALIAVGRRDDARPLVALLERRGAELDRGWAIAVGARCRGLLLAADGELDAAERALEEALRAHERLPMPIERGRSLLALGRIRRRMRKRLAARAALDEAVELFERAGSPRWTAQAEQERDALGLRRGPADALTPSEERIARLAASGLTNRAVADALIVSPKTVEAHLARVYRKLGIRSRAELGARMTRLDAGEPG